MIAQAVLEPQILAAGLDVSLSWSTKPDKSHVVEGMAIQNGEILAEADVPQEHAGLLEAEAR